MQIKNQNSIFRIAQVIVIKGERISHSETDTGAYSEAILQSLALSFFMLFRNETCNEYFM